VVASEFDFKVTSKVEVEFGSLGLAWAKDRDEVSAKGRGDFNFALEQGNLLNTGAGVTGKPSRSEMTAMTELINTDFEGNHEDVNNQFTRVTAKIEVQDRILARIEQNHPGMLDPWTQGEAAEGLDPDKDVFPDDELVRDMVNGWAKTSGQTKEAIALQLSANEEFGMESTVSHFNEGQLSKARDWLNLEAVVRGTDLNPGVTNSELQRAFLRAQYEVTQEELRRVGINFVTLIRGVKRAGLASPGGFRDINLQPLSSFSSNNDIARSFAGHGQQDGSMLYVIRVPASQVMSTARTGLGCLNEYECVVLGRPTGAWTTQSSIMALDEFGEWVIPGTPGASSSTSAVAEKFLEWLDSLGLAA